MNTNPPTIEAIVRTPLGTVRVWIDLDGAVRTSINAEIGGGGQDPATRPQVLAVADQAGRTIRAMLGCDAGSPANPGAVAEWFAERAVADDGGRVPSLDAYEDYLAWCEGRRLRPLSLRLFGDALSDRGMHAVKDRFGRKVRRGLTLKGPGEAAALRVVG